MRLNDIIDRIRLPFRKEKELFSALHAIMGFYPHNIEHYKIALTHKSSGQRGSNGKPLNNERLEFLGDAMLDAVVGHIVFERFTNKREGFLTNTRSKLVSRDSLGKLAAEMGLTDLIQSRGEQRSHNSYMAGNAFEALVGAIYLDQGYDAVRRFMEKRILKQMVNIDKVAYKEVNFKSKLLEWTQKNRVRMEYRMLKQTKDDKGSPIFGFIVMIEGVEGGKGQGFSKKEAQQLSWPRRRRWSACAASLSSSTPSSPPRATAPRWRKNRPWPPPTWKQPRPTSSSSRNRTKLQAKSLSRTRKRHPRKAR